MSAAAGLAHVRRIPLALGAVVVGCIGVALFWDLYIEVSAVAGNPVRGLRAPELFGAVLAVCLPALTAPDFDGREKLITLPTRRLTHTVLSTAVLLAPLLVLPVWRVAVGVGNPLFALQPVARLGGELLLIAVASTLAVLLLGRLWGTVTGAAAATALVVVQQAFPAGFLATHFDAGRVWHTDWPLTTTLIVVAVALNHRLSSVARGSV